MDDKTALNGFKNLLNDIDKDNHLFIGTINPEMIKVAISAIESKYKPKSEDER
jgi:hypothetical protein